ncbi:MAG TPA: BtpA/SgcQ family protein [Lutibacter sp.]|nr:BtpA/SgcQ family protein [Lutibacter sp.]
MNKFESIFRVKHPIIGMIHVQALPGTPNYQGDSNFVIDKALQEARLYKQLGIDALMLENMHDVPYQKNGVGAEITSMMTLIASTIKQETKLPLGIQILAGANKEALAVAKAAQLEFIRAEGFVFGHVADEGYIDSQAADLLRYRKQIDAAHIAVFTDIKKKHSSHAITADVNLVETAHAAEFFLSDGLIITGKQTGFETDIDEIKAVKSHTNLPVIIGSGISIDNVAAYLPISDAMIVGSYFKKDGFWKNDLEASRIKGFMAKVNELRQKT